jgi:hypothetical protein
LQTTISPASIAGSENNDLGYEILEYEDQTIIVGWTNGEIESSRRITDEGLTDEVTNPNNSINIFIQVLSADSEIVSTLVFGGSGNDIPYAVDLTPDGDLVIVGVTSSDDLPMKDPDDFSFEQPSGGEFEEFDGFLLKVSLDGSLVWSTYLGGFGSDYLTSVTVDPYTGEIYASGFSNSNQGILLNPGNMTVDEDYLSGEGILVKYSPEGEKQFGYYFGGNGTDILYDISLANDSSIYLSGISNSFDLFEKIGRFESRTYEVLDQHQIENSTRSIFVMKFNLEIRDIEWVRPLGTINEVLDPDTGNQQIELRKFEEYTQLELVPEKSLTVGYSALSSTTNVVDSNVARLTLDGDISWEWSSNGDASDRLIDLEVLADESVIIAGKTSSVNYPVKHAVNSIHAGRIDAYVTRIDKTGELLWSTFIGGSLEDVAMTIQLKEDSVRVLGYTQSNDFQGESFTIKGLTDYFVLELPTDLQDSGGLTRNNFLQFLDAFIKNTSFFEILMLIFGIFFGYTSVIYFRRTQVGEYLLLSSIFAGLLLTSFLSFLTRVSKVQVAFDFILFRQPFLGWTVLSVLLLAHAYRIKWYGLPKQQIAIASFLLILKLVVLGFVFASGQFASFNESRTATIVGISFLITFLLFDIYVIVILNYAYNNLEFVLNTNQVRNAFRLWRAAWVFYGLGYLFLLIYTVLQLFLFQNLGSLSEEIAASTELQLVSIYRVFDLIMQSGVTFFIVVVLIGIIAVRYPEGVLISHAQVARAAAIYDKTKTMQDEKKPVSTPGKTSIQDYLANAMKMLEEEAD